MEWNSNLYNDKHGFVAEYGKELLSFIPQNKEQSILDLGCGTGTLTSNLVPFAKRVVGVDSSQNMINKAKEQNKEIDFLVCDALKLPFDKEFDIVFSNAVFHWISNHDCLLQNVYKALKQNGMLICEFGAKGNISIIENAFLKACSEYKIDYTPKFNFPSVEAFSSSLLLNGFTINRIYDFDRPTVLKGGEKGLENWIKQFFAAEIEKMPMDIQNEIIKTVEQDTKKMLWNGNQWVADYRRLRTIAYIK